MADWAHTSPPPPRPETYVIQIPKDQVYRIPPPENAYLADRYRRKHKHRKIAGGSCPPCLCHILAAVVSLTLLVFTAAAAFYFVVKPGIPKFAVTGFNGSSSGKYEITLKAYNPSEKMGYLYGIGGKTVLSLGDLTIASGEPPEFYQSYRNETNINLHVAGKQIEQSSNYFTMEVEFPLRSKVGEMKLWGMKLDVNCKFSIRSTKKDMADIERQQCGAKLNL